MKKFVFLLFIISLALNLHGQEASQVDESQNSESLPRMGLKVFRLINQHRAENSLPHLEWDSSIVNQAREHSLNMANDEISVGHQDAKQRFEALRKTIPSLVSYGENVAFNSGFSDPAENAVEGWLDSEEHYANIMGDFNLTGVGVAVNPQGEYYFTQIFVKTDLATEDK